MMAPRPETATCQTCCYWKPDENNGSTGQCRRDPPVVFEDDISNWPPTEATDWCGHYNDDWDERK